MAGSAFAAQSHARDFADINITPLVDVMLVLLIIFMVASPTLTKAIEFDLPQPDKGNPPAPVSIHLGIAADGTITWNGTAQPHSALHGMMSEEAQRDPRNPPMLQIDASGDADYGVVTRVLATARAAELDRIAFVQR
jgi:biopolymer transport protein ExbD